MLSMEMQRSHLIHGISSLPSASTHNSSTVGTPHHLHHNHMHYLHRQQHHSNQQHSNNSNNNSNNNNNNSSNSYTAGHPQQQQYNTQALHHIQQHLQHLDSSLMQNNSNDHNSHTQLTDLQSPQTLTYDVKSKVHKLDEYCLTSNGNTISTNTTSAETTAQVPSNFMSQTTAVEWITVMNENHNNAEDSRSSQGSISGDDVLCIKRWACLRDRYVREKRAENLPSGSGSKVKSQWPLMAAMEFIAPHIIPRPVRSSFNILSETKTSTNVELSPPLFDSQSSSPAAITNTISPSPDTRSQNSFESILELPKTPDPSTPKVQKRKRNAQDADLDNSILEAVGAFKKLCEEKSERNRVDENNPLHGFGQMIVATIGQMSSTQQIIAMQRVTALVMEMKLESESN